ncbi:MAG: LacI family DNA-binding transcriptional regulator [Kiritimatiellia bacterium]
MSSPQHLHSEAEPGPNTGRVTQAQIAEKLELAPMTVSRALRGDPKVKTSTRERIERCAAELGYRPDPLLSSLTRYRRRTPDRIHYNQIAFLTNFEDEDGWRDSSDLVLLYEGAQAAAVELGYELVPTWLRQPKQGKQGKKRLADILWARGVQGLLLAHQTPHMARGHLRFDWDRFSVVSLGPSPAKPELCAVDYDSAHAVRLACHELRHRGYRRIGFAHYVYTNAQHDNTPLSAFLGEQWSHAHTGKVKPFLWRKEGLPEMLAWVEREQPDVLLTNRCGPGSHPQEISRLWAKDASPLPCFFYALYESDPVELPGVFHPLRRLGAEGMRALHGYLQRGVRGLPSHPHTLTFRGSWRE